MKYAVNYYGRMDGELLGGIVDNKTYDTKEEAIKALENKLIDESYDWLQQGKEKYIEEYGEDIDENEVICSNNTWCNGMLGELRNTTNGKDDVVNYEVIELDGE